MSCTNAFLKEDIYMIQPPGFVDSCFPRHLCKLHKSLYGLKQVPQAWFERFSNHLPCLGFQSKYVDPSLFIRNHCSTITIVLLYVDDLVITGNDNTYISTLMNQRSLIFEMKHSGALHHLLSIEVDRTS